MSWCRQDVDGWAFGTVDKKAMRKTVIAQSNKPAVVNMATAQAAGIKLLPAALSVAVGLVVKFLVPVPAGLTIQ
eukprot:2653259-Pyramimonas_sp.AAC.1